MRWNAVPSHPRLFRLFEHRVLRRIFGLKKEEVKGKWRRMHDEELYSLYFLPILFI